MVTYHDGRAGPSRDIQLSVDASDMTLTVAQGDFRDDGVDYQITDDVEVTFDIQNYRRSVFGFLVEVVATGEITILYDERGPGDVPYDFGAENTYRLIERLLIAEIPADANDLTHSSVKIDVTRVVSSAQE
jgi:hypothetical protein